MMYLLTLKVTEMEPILVDNKVRVKIGEAPGGWTVVAVDNPKDQFVKGIGMFRTDSVARTKKGQSINFARYYYLDMEGEPVVTTYYSEFEASRYMTKLEGTEFTLNFVEKAK